MSKVFRGMMFNNECRFYLTDATDMIQDISEKTTYSPTAIAALGRSIMITNILGIMEKDFAKISTIINGGGDLGEIVCTTVAKGKIKGKVKNPLANPPKINERKLNVGLAVGSNGFLRVIKDLGLKEPFVGDVSLVNGEIGMDFVNYFTKSEQTPTAIAVGVLINTDHSIKNASCFVVQLMPEASEDTINKLEEFFENLQGLSEIMTNISEMEFLEKYFKDEFNVLEEVETKFECDCSYERFLNALKMLPASDIIDLKKDKAVECTCDFCYKSYDIITENI